MRRLCWPLLLLLTAVPMPSGSADAPPTGAPRADPVPAVAAHPDPAAAAPRVEAFSPKGEVHRVRQVTARFSEPMVAFGDPRTEAPFDVHCSEAGHAHWADARNWVYDFERDLPGDLTCSFSLRQGLKTLSGAPLAPAQYGFDTGGPEVLKAYPVDGEEDIDEHQVFLLGLSAAADPGSVQAHAWCAVDQVGERIPVEVLVGKERGEVLSASRKFAREFFTVLGKRGWRGILAIKDHELEQLPVTVLRCSRPLPARAKVSLVWGAGVRGANSHATRQDQKLAYQVHEDFQASIECTRLDPKGNCVPIAPIRLRFSAPVARGLAAGVRLAGTTDFPAQIEAGKPFVEGLEFPGPFPEGSDLVLTLPRDLHDDGGRPLANAGEFPAHVHLDAGPPLIKFAAPFGILEANAGPALPVSVRNVETHLAAQLATRQSAAGAVGKLARLARDDDQAIARWYHDVTQERDVSRRVHPGKAVAGEPPPQPAEFPLLDGSDPALPAKAIRIPDTRADHALEVIGVPLPGPGMYIVEFASPRLGAALLAKPKPFYVHAGALVTNLSIHFKHGRESSLAWVTRLDNAQPVADAEVHVADCLGDTEWTGRTDAQGIAHIPVALPGERNLWDECPGYGSAKLVTARSAGDLSFMFTHWNQGLANWQFNLPWGGAGMPEAAHTVTDRPLFRTGETVSMKHYFRLRSGDGFKLQPEGSLPTTAIISHQGSGESYELALTWHDGNASSRWAIPADAKLGSYDITLRRGDQSWESGSFRVEHYRIPLMRAVLTPPAAAVVRAASISIDAQLSYLSGGPAGDAPVRVRSQTSPSPLSFPDYPDFAFGGELPHEGISSEAPGFEYDPGGEGTATDETGDAGDAGDAGDGGPRAPNQVQVLRTQELVLDREGGRRIIIDHLPQAGVPQSLQVEMEYQDPNGAVLNASTSVRLLPSAVVLGIRTGVGFATQDALAFRVVALDPRGKPLAGQTVSVEAWSRRTFAYRKRLIGGFYGYEQNREVHRLGPVCHGSTNAQGLLLCSGTAPASGELVLVARANDAAGNPGIATANLYVGGEDDWFAAGASDRMDLLADQLAYEPGATAHIQVRMPFREATALVAVEREGVLSTRLVHLSGRSPVIDVPMAGSYGPNAYVSVLAVRGRIDPEQPGTFAWLRRLVWKIGHWLGFAGDPPALVDTRPTGLVDLTRPAFRLGVIPIKVGWQDYTLKVKVETDRAVYRVRDHVHVRIHVSDSRGQPAAHASVALAAVDEGLLELAPATSWNLLDAMMAPRGLQVETSTAQSQVIGRRHFGKKAAPPGGGGGGLSARELFDTLLDWRPEVPLDAQGQAEVDIPLNDSLTSFRIEAIAAQGARQFGSASASIRTSQDLMLYAGLAPLVREGDRYNSLVTVRNTSARTLDVDIHARTDAGSWHSEPGDQQAHLDPGQAKTLTFATTAPFDQHRLDWTIEARARGASGPGSSDLLKQSQQVAVAVPVRVLERTLLQLQAGQPATTPVALPKGAIPGRGGVDIRLAASLGGDLASVHDWFDRYPYDCIEQQASRAIAEQDRAEWDRVMGLMPTYLDSDGLVRYFPSPSLEGDDTLTSYLVAIADEAGYAIPEITLKRMLSGLDGFVAGRIHRYGKLDSADLMIRRLAALEALSRHGAAHAGALTTLDIAPDLWPSSAVLDWISLLGRLPELKDREARLAQARGILRARLTWSGTRVSFSTEKSDALWWLMVSPDLNAVRSLRLLSDDPTFRDDLPRLARGAIERQQQGHWSTTVANAWGVLALKRFRERYEHDPVGGTTHLVLGDAQRDLGWTAASRQGVAVRASGPFGEGVAALEARLPWPPAPGKLSLEHAGSGRPWAFVSASAALPLTEPLYGSMRLKRTVTPVEQKHTGRWTRGDVYQVALELELQGDETWVAVDDPVPAGATILGSGLGGDSAQLAGMTDHSGQARPEFAERRADAYIAYFSWLPKGQHHFEYRVRLNGSGQFGLPAARAEAMYAPEVMAMVPVAAMTVAEP